MIKSYVHQVTRNKHTWISSLNLTNIRRRESRFVLYFKLYLTTHKLLPSSIRNLKVLDWLPSLLLYNNGYCVMNIYIYGCSNNAHRKSDYKRYNGSLPIKNSYSTRVARVLKKLIWRREYNWNLPISLNRTKQHMFVSSIPLNKFSVQFQMQTGN